MIRLYAAYSKAYYSKCFWNLYSISQLKPSAFYYGLYWLVQPRAKEERFDKSSNMPLITPSNQVLQRAAASPLLRCVAVQDQLDQITR